MSDQNLKQNVLDELSWDPIINAAHIGVTTRRCCDVKWACENLW